jgi:sugar lactone lactonase YvrE
MPKFETLVSGLSLTECPRWHDGRLYFSDFYTQRVLAVALDGTVQTVAEVPGPALGTWISARRPNADCVNARPQDHAS